MHNVCDIFKDEYDLIEEIFSKRYTLYCTCESKLKFKKNNKIEIWAKSISNLELDLDKAESNEITDWKDEKNYWLFLNQKMPTKFFE